MMKNKKTNSNQSERENMGQRKEADVTPFREKVLVLLLVLLVSCSFPFEPNHLLFPATTALDKRRGKSEWEIT